MQGASEEPGPSVDPAVPVPVPAAEARSAAPGIRRFAAVEPKLAGGSLPTTAGLDWLAEKGYKTVLDLRESGADSTSYASEVTSRGLRYVALPISLQTVDSKHLELFSAELSLSEARPLYFCDTDGDRAGVLWYLRRITVDKVDPQDASREAQEMGLRDKEFWLAASKYLESLKPADSEAGPPAPRRRARRGPAAGRGQARGHPPHDLARADAEGAQCGDRRGDGASRRRRKSSRRNRTAPRRDSASWSPLAALMITGLGAPLAYWGRSGFPIRCLARASLPAPVHRPKSLPGASGE